MASYSYGYTKYVDSPQGNLDLGQIAYGTGGNIVLSIMPNSFYTFKSLQWYIDNGYFYYASEYRNPLDDTEGKGKFPKMFTIGEINGVKILGAFYWNDFNVPVDTPPLIATPNIRLYLISGDLNGTVTERNPMGLRIGSSYQVEWTDTSKFYINTELQTTSYMYSKKPSAFFGNTELDSALHLFVNVKEESEIEVNVNPPSVNRYISTVPQGELSMGKEYYSVYGFRLADVLGNAIDIDDLPEDVGTSSTGGGGGSFDMSSGIVGLPPLPTLGAANSGLVTMYNPTIAELRSLSNWLWSNNLLDNLEKMFAQPLDLIISLSISPIPPNQIGASQEVKIGGVGTDINMHRVNNQYAVFDCGYLDVTEYYGSALDYGQYTKISLYLPFCNVVQLKTDEVMGSRVRVVYYADLFTGSCVAFVIIKRGNLDAILYSFEGNMAVTLPLISRDFSNLYNSIAKTGINALSGGFGMTDALNSALNVMSTKPNLNRTGGSTATGGLLGVKYPYLIIERPIQSLAKGYNRFVGYPSNITAYLYSLDGYTEVEEVICDGLSCTKEEQDAIVAKLKKGVII